MARVTAASPANTSTNWFCNWFSGTANFGLWVNITRRSIRTAGALHFKSDATTMAPKERIQVTTRVAGVPCGTYTTAQSMRIIGRHGHGMRTYMYSWCNLSGKAWLKHQRLIVLTSGHWWVLFRPYSAEHAHSTQILRLRIDLQSIYVWKVWIELGWATTRACKAKIVTAAHSSLMNHS